MHNACPGLSSGTVPLPGDAQYRPGGGGARRGEEEEGGRRKEEEAEFIRIQWMLF